MPSLKVKQYGELLSLVYICISLVFQCWQLQLFCPKEFPKALAGVAQGLSTGLQIRGSLVRFPVRAHAWVAGQVPSGGHVRGNHTLMFLYLSFSLPFPSV